MTPRPDTTLEQRLRVVGRVLPYPPTPRLDQRLVRPGRPRPVQSLRRGWRSTIAIAIVIATLLTVPTTRAAIVRLVIGVIEIVPAVPTPTPNLPTVAPRATATPTPIVATPTATATTLDLDQLTGETTLADARDRVRFPLRLPTYPADLGPPDRVFVQDLAGAAIISVWTAPDDPEHARLVLYALTSPVLGRKLDVETLEQTTVDGRRAVWVSGPHFLQLKGTGDWQIRRLVSGNTLVWTDRGITYRLESGLELDEARRIAESSR